MKRLGAISLSFAVISAALCIGGTVAPASAGAAPAEASSYPDTDSASADIATAIQRAAKLDRRVLVDFGANWCGDCKVLDANFHRPDNLALLREHYVVVHVNVGEKGIDHNEDLADRYGVPLKKGIPALAVLDKQGHVIYSQKNGEFESMNRVDPESVHQFLLQWAN